jgi:hypothetical protein
MSIFTKREHPNCSLCKWAREVKLYKDRSATDTQCTAIAGGQASSVFDTRPCRALYERRKA